MVYKKFKDFKLEVIRMIFEEKPVSEIISHIDALEVTNLITPSQVQYLLDMIYNSDKFTLTGSRQNENFQILVYKKKIIASYDGKKGVYLE